MQEAVCEEGLNVRLDEIFLSTVRGHDTKNRVHGVGDLARSLPQMHASEARRASTNSMWDPRDDEIRRLREELDRIRASQVGELLSIRQEMTRLYGGVFPRGIGDGSGDGGGSGFAGAFEYFIRIEENYIKLKLYGYSGLMLLCEIEKNKGFCAVAVKLAMELAIDYHFRRYMKPCAEIGYRDWIEVYLNFSWCKNKEDYLYEHDV
ncbi:unnamed protein product [Cuscuta campestris]|uniref:Uncharacterized protein n=1 Tax=Cuscuta campestris TaxID=132261 RepID=A0A484NCE4_9ASTE|nr:unnamed protein product [Cuscuta campestris]